MSKYSGVEDTLFIPLVGRINASKNYKEFFYDSKAIELEKYIDTDLLKNNTSEYFTMATISRFYELDNLVKKFIFENGECNIICLGCGFDTMYFRVDDSKATFYEIDLENVIKLREKLLGNNKNEVLISSNILNYSWIDKVDTSKPSLVIASGVFHYFNNNQVFDLIQELKHRFNEISLAFDTTNRIGLKRAEKYVRSTGNSNIEMFFYVSNAKKFADKTNTGLLQVIPFFTNCRKILKKRLKFTTKLTCFFADKLGFSKIIYLKLK